MSNTTEMIDAYSEGVTLLRASLEHADARRYDERPIPGKWSIREVVCHLADSEIVYADRMKRVLAENDPLFFEADPELFRSALSAERRWVDVELNVIAAVRQHMIPILRSADDAKFERMGRHSLDGPMTLRTLLQRITNHIPHHIRFIDEKVAAMAG
jgi:uncharacterized damage-inducible protein DinB